MPLPYPDEELLQKQLSIYQFTAAAEAFRDTYPEHMNSVARFVLAGRSELTGGDFLERILVNARESGEAPEPTGFRLTRDYDSIIGMSRNLPYTDCVSVYPVPPFSDTLTKDNHMVFSLPNRTGALVPVSLNRIPNLAFGKVKARHSIRLFFPEMYDPQSPAAIPQATMALVYDKCIKASVDEIIPYASSHWPADYTTAMRQYRDNLGRIRISTIDIPGVELRAFSAAVIARLEEHRQFKGAFFLHELRGTKGETQHDPDDLDERRSAFDDLMRFVDQDAIDKAEWWIDVALELRYPGHVVHWLRHGHAHVLDVALPSSSPGDKAWLLASKKYYLDEVAQLQDLAGFRMTPGSRGRRDNVAYVNVYTTDKSPTYQLHKGIFYRNKPNALLPTSISKLTRDVEEMSKTFTSCAENEQEGCARLEVRVPLEQALSVLIALGAEIIEHSIVVIPSDTWWRFKNVRLGAIHHVLGKMMAADKAARAWPASLELGAALIWMLNALNYRPQKYPEHDALRDTCCKHKPCPDGELNEDDDSPATIPVGYEGGLYFLSDIIFDHAPRLPVGRKLDGHYLLSLYERARLRDIQSFFVVNNQIIMDPAVADQRPSSGIRVPNKRRGPTNHVVELGEALPGDQVVNFRLLEQGVILNRRIYMVPDGEEDFTQEEELASLNDTVDIIITKIWRQFPSDVFASSPNTKGGGAHVLRDAASVSSIKDDVFYHMDLSSLFEQVQCMTWDKAGWEDHVFKWYFPEHGRPPRRKGQLQNFHTCRYYIDWFDVMARVSERHGLLIRRAVFKEFAKFAWVPQPSWDRMWNTKIKRTKNVLALPAGSERKACPQIAINHPVGSTSMVILGKRSEGRGRIGEGSDDD